MLVLKLFDTALVRVLATFIKTESSRETVRQFIKFALIGVVNTGIDFGIYVILTRFIPTAIPYVLASVISFVIATTFSFFANRTWTFLRTDKATVGEAARFYATTLSGLALNSGLLYVLVRFLGVNDLLSKVFATVVTIFWNFLFKKFYVFVPKKEEGSVA